MFIAFLAVALGLLCLACFMLGWVMRGRRGGEPALAPSRSAQPDSAEKFLDRLRRSGLVEESRLTSFLSELREQEVTAARNDSDLLAKRLVEAKLITPWQSEKLLEGRHKGFYLGKYKLLGRLGARATSSVYLAEHVLMHRSVAIKVLPQSRSDDASYLAWFRREAMAAAELDHRHTARIYDVDHDGKIHFAVMEYLVGRDLQSLVGAEGPLECYQAAKYIVQAAKALHHAHEAGVIHRNIKPANLLVNDQGLVKVLDMGLGGVLDAKAMRAVPQDKDVPGLADYLSPEQLNGQAVDRRTDIYSLGCTLYFLLSGHPPFGKGSLSQRIRQQQTAMPPAIRLERSDVPRDLVRICNKMMGKTPAERYQTAADVAGALGDLPHD